jgi:hypothetical protein
MGCCFRSNRREKETETAHSDRRLIRQGNVKVCHNVEDIVHPSTTASDNASRKSDKKKRFPTPQPPVPLKSPKIELFL